jgi:hypothetical protein
MKKTWVLALSLAALAATMTSGSLANAEEPLRLLLTREAPSGAADCARGSLLVVRSFDELDVSKGVQVGDIVETRAAAGFLSSGLHTGTPRDDGEEGWRIELEGAADPVALRAQPSGDLADAMGSVLLGRSREDASTGACALADVRLKDGAILMQRLRRLYASPANDRPIEVLITP